MVVLADDDYTGKANRWYGADTTIRSVKGI